MTAEDTSGAIPDEVLRLRYWMALGRFIDSYAQAEFQLIALLKKLARLSDTAAWAILSGTRADAGKDFINRYLEAKGDAVTKKRLERPFAQLGVLTTMRNNIVHWGGEATVGSSSVIVSNIHLWTPDERLRGTLVTASDLEDMAEDALQISVAFLEEIKPTKDDPRWAAYVAQPWRYTRPPPLPPPKGRRARLQARQRPPAASG